ncbi:MYND-type domain-containing protein [Mycena chlorophos]|uniref:MYND-type domain-containing protein n=1 Tax=Mycena chlorophos TaxID=658473 RepID=A0A8H6S0E9_MYCCL|nr:MYND-type domain-containing protein [Mycena chlorophos]
MSFPKIPGVHIEGVAIGPNSGGTRRLAVHTCSNIKCTNHENLKKCAKCWWATYCSKACQKADWANHKDTCKAVTATRLEADAATNGEPPIRRNLRHWTQRFDRSLAMAIISGLGLPQCPDHLDKYALLLTLRPRPHPEVGSRFEFVDASPMFMDTVQMFLDAAPERQGAVIGDALAAHRKYKEESKRRSGGNDDFGMVVILAENDGPHAFPGGKRTEIRFKPVSLSWRTIADPYFLREDLNWRLNLAMHINCDMPTQTVLD